MRSIEDRIRGLPPELRREVEDFLDFLVEKRANRRRGCPIFNWAGALKDIGGRQSSVELQHKISEWRIGET